MPFVLRQENDTENPPLACVYGKQSTEGRIVYFIKESGRTKCIIFLGEGEMDGIDKIYFHGGTLPEFDDAGGRIWRFHPGTLTDKTTGFSDPIQGKPEFFQSIPFTFSGIAYLEVHLPVDLSEIDDEEPTGFKIFVRGKRLQNYDANGLIADRAGVAYPNQAAIPADSKFFSANNALVALDIMFNSMNLSHDRIDWASWVAYRNHCDTLIDWNSGLVPVKAEPIWGV